MGSGLWSETPAEGRLEESRGLTSSCSTRSLARGSNPSGKVNSSALIFWNVRYSVRPRKGGTPAISWKRMHPIAQKSDLYGRERGGCQ